MLTLESPLGHQHINVYLGKKELCCAKPKPFQESVSENDCGSRNFKMNFDENLHDRRIVNKCNLNLTFHFQIISLNNQGIYIFLVDWLGLAALSRLWIKTDGFSSLLALLLQMLPPLSRVKHSDGQLVSNFFFEGFPYFVFIS